MSFTEKHIVETYSRLIESLSSLSKIQLIENLSKSLIDDTMSKESKFYKSFGAFASKKTAEEIVKEIKSSRSFRNKEINF